MPHEPGTRYPWLGVHLTRTVDDEVLVGPTAVPALALEGYRRRAVRAGVISRWVAWSGGAAWPGPTGGPASVGRLGS